ncbi:amylo-alpha-1,6-glucosidase [Methylobacterium platani]|uniref:Glycogen debranching protein n=2 Tax=Methylobacterium platani TaxID=427683 RepID=A0A179S0C5_9HYPH|nr:amylo-alpha-1,6-glucosidase [Methylobacterium platani]KMO15459.1 glycogen debranching protein [Methylobacterium platani JCM 14648]OAS18579.1 glycogen debranching protein [Methylobacterium platani]
MDDPREWLEADGLGGFASGPVAGPRTRRYHALLLTATTPPTGRVVLVNGIEAEATTAGGSVPLSTQAYAPDVVHPDGWRHVAGFAPRPWPTWTLRLPDGTALRHEILVEPDSGETLLRWERLAGDGPCTLAVRPLLSGRDYHALHHENPAFAFAANARGGNVAWRPYPDLPAVAALTNGTYAHAPDWYRRFRYAAEAARGLDDTEDLARPGTFAFDLAAGPAVLILRSGDGLSVRAAAHADRLIAAERARRAALTPLALTAGAYLVDRPGGRTLLAGFPWFTDWGRDTFIALRGLLVATGALAQARAILLAWAGAVSEGMMPNRFPDRAEAPEYNAVDASLWYVVAVDDVLAAHEAAGQTMPEAQAARLARACAAILDGYAAGTRYGIAADADGLLRAGVPGVQLTWMDAKVGDRVITPRIGKPVEVQALWINALRIGIARWSPRWRELERRASAAFVRFVSPSGALHDVIDAGHVPGAVDSRFRPNQILAVGGLPHGLLDGDAARAVVDAVEARLLTPLGLRSLDPADPDYRGTYAGGPAERDGAYHQGTVWPWLIGPFVDAWLGVRGRTPEAKAEARARFLPSLAAHLAEAGLGHVSEVADGDPPHRPGGCPFQAWSLGELIRVRRMLDLDPV